MMIWGLVYGIILTTLHNTLQKRSATSHHQGHIPSEIATVQCTARRVRIRRRRLPLTRAPSPFTVSFLAFRVAFRVPAQAAKVSLTNMNQEIFTCPVPSFKQTHVRTSHSHLQKQKGVLLNDQHQHLRSI